MHLPKNLNELRGLQGKLAYIRRFIANLSGRCQPFTRLMKKGVSFVWDQGCQESYEDIKRYLTKPLVLVAPTSGKPFLLYVKVWTILSVLCLLRKMIMVMNRLFTI